MHSAVYVWHIGVVWCGQMQALSVEYLRSSAPRILCRSSTHAGRSLSPGTTSLSTVLPLHLRRYVNHTRGVRQSLSAFQLCHIHRSFNLIPIHTPMPAKHLVPFPSFSGTDIPFHSLPFSFPLLNPYIIEYRLCGTIIGNTVCNYSTILHTIQHCISNISNTNSRHNFQGNSPRVTEDEINHTAGLCLKAANKHYKVYTLYFAMKCRLCDLTSTNRSHSRLFERQALAVRLDLCFRSVYFFLFENIFRTAEPISTKVCTVTATG